MRYTVIGYRGTEDRVNTVRIFDVKTYKTIERTIPELGQNLYKPSKVSNLEISDGKLMWTCGSAGRYPHIHSNGVVTNKYATTIVDRHSIGNGEFMYLVVSITGECHWLTKEQVDKLNSTAPITNCKVIHKDGSTVIQHIAGDFDDNGVSEIISDYDTTNGSRMTIPSGMPLKVLDLRHNFSFSNEMQLIPSFYERTIEVIKNPVSVTLDTAIDKPIKIRQILNDNNSELRIRSGNYWGREKPVYPVFEHLQSIRTEGKLILDVSSRAYLESLNEIKCAELEFSSSSTSGDMPNLDISTVDTKISRYFPDFACFTSTGVLTLTDKVSTIGSFGRVRNLKKVVLNSQRVAFSCHNGSNYDGIISVPEYFLCKDELYEHYPYARVEQRHSDIDENYRKKVNKMQLIGKEYNSDSDEGIKSLLMSASQEAVKNLLIKALNTLASNRKYSAAFGPYAFEFAITGRNRFGAPKVFEEAVKFSYDGNLVIVPITKNALLVPDPVLYEGRYGYSAVATIHIPVYKLPRKGPIESIKTNTEGKCLDVKFKDGETVKVTKDMAF